MIARISVSTLYVRADCAHATVELDQISLSPKCPRFRSSLAYLNLDFDKHYRCMYTSCLYALYEYRLSVYVCIIIRLTVHAVCIPFFCMCWMHTKLADNVSC